MVEVDVFWAYGIGAACASAAGTPVARAPAPLDTPYFTRTLLLLALVWAPTGLLLLLRHPSWETMQVADSFAALPPWLVIGFGLTNITQGIVGFWAASRLLRAGRRYAAELHWLAGYFGMFFILLYGWDGRGFDRFLYDRDMFGGAAWTPGAGLQPGAGVEFLISSVAQTLYLDGLYLLPFLLLTTGRWQRAEATLRGGPARGVLGWAGVHLGMIFGVALSAAAIAALSVHAFAGLFAGLPGGWVLSYLVGLPLALAGLWLALYAPGRPLHRRLSRLLGLDAGA
jgi:hypothetical protein